MSTTTTSGKELPLHPAEESCPYIYWVPWLKNLAFEIIKKLHLPLQKGDKYSAKDFWEGLILHALMSLPIDEAAERLNQMKWEEFNHPRRRKKLPKKLNSKVIRHERMTPHGDQIRKYRNTLPMWVVKRLNEVIFDAQLVYALREGLIEKSLTVIVDNNDQWYYGSDRYPDNPYINKSHKGPGTSRRRKYLGIMIRSKKTSLYVGVSLIKKEHSNVPDIMNCIDRLIQQGYHIDHLQGDRWFPTYECLSELKRRNINYIGPYKKWKPIKRLIEDYIKNGGNYIHQHLIKGDPTKYYHLSPIPIYIIFTNRQGRRLREIRQDWKQKKISLKEATKQIMVMATTFTSPSGKKQRHGWAIGICKKYDKRWQIETGFRDLNRISPPSNAHTNARKYMMRSAQYWVYNAWQIERAKRKRMQKVPKSWMQGPTLRQFTYAQLQKYRDHIFI